MYSLDSPIQSEDDGQPLATSRRAGQRSGADVVGTVMEERLANALAALPADYRPRFCSATLSSALPGDRGEYAMRDRHRALRIHAHG